MKNLLLIADSTYVAKDENGCIYFRGSFSDKTWERYFNIAEHILFICREDKKIYAEHEAKEQLQKANSNQIEVSFISNPKNSICDYFNPNIKKKNRELLEKAISAADGVIIRTLGSVSASFIIKTIRKYEKRYMYECVGNAWDALWNYGVKGKVLAPNAYFTEKKLASNADAVLYVTEKYLQRWYPTNAPQVGISDVDIPITTNNILEERINKINNKGKRTIIGTVGSVDVAYKGQEYVIKAIAELKRRGIMNLEYQLVGNGVNDRLKQIAILEGVESQISFLGMLSHDAVFDWMDSIDIYIQPSMLEGMPRALIEAMSRGVPCLGSRVGGVPELLDEKCMFQKKNVQQIADIIERMSEELLRKEAKRNFELSKKFYPTEKEKLRRKFYQDFENKCMKNKVR